MNTSSSKKVIASVVGVLAILVIVFLALKTDRTAEPAASDETNASASSTTPVLTPVTVPASSTPVLSSTSVFAYSVTTPKSSYGQNEQIPMTISVLNLTNEEKTMDFKNGCMADYSIADFDMLAHITCSSGPQSFTIAPHAVKQVYVTHYPSVYVIPAGTYELKGSIVGYGGMSVPITITK